MLAREHIDHGMVLVFVGPAEPGEALQEGDRFVVENVSNTQVIAHPEMDPGECRRFPLRAGRLFRFRSTTDTADKLNSAVDLVERLSKEYKDKYGEHIQKFNERQMSDEERRDHAKRAEIAQKLLELKSRQGKTNDPS